MLATLTDTPFSDPDWIYERKFDGERCLGLRDGAEVRLLSRSGQALTATYPEAADVLARQPCRDFLVDGEVVAFEGTRTSFARLQQRMGVTDEDQARTSRIAIAYYVFDLLRLDGRDLTGLPLRTRKALLRRALTYTSPLRFATHRNSTGEAYLDQACERGWEGLIAKQADSGYVSRRSADWLKFKCGNRGACGRRLHRTGGPACRIRCPAGRLLRRPAPDVRGKGRHRLRRANSDGLAQAAGCPGARRPAVRR
ncbi:hypothetical protein [Streptomyces sp. OE57]|uniref:ATP-dependent DNA ligase n=1 Tax=Streptomyces lacaronensis TaxID=3379885 RepID=UPI0039B742E9